MALTGDVLVYNGLMKWPIQHTDMIVIDFLPGVWGQDVSSNFQIDREVNVLKELLATPGSLIVNKSLKVQHQHGRKLLEQ